MTNLELELRRMDTLAHLRKLHSKRQRREALVFLAAAAWLVCFLGWHLMAWANRARVGELISAWLD